MDCADSAPRSYLIRPQLNAVRQAALTLRLPSFLFQLLVPAVMRLQRWRYRLAPWLLPPPGVAAGPLSSTVEYLAFYRARRLTPDLVLVIRLPTSPPPAGRRGDGDGISSTVSTGDGWAEETVVLTRGSFRLSLAVDLRARSIELPQGTRIALIGGTNLLLGEASGWDGELQQVTLHEVRLPRTREPLRFQEALGDLGPVRVFMSSAAA